MILNNLLCPNCYAMFDDKVDRNQQIVKCSVKIDKEYSYDLVKTVCKACKKEILALLMPIPILWLKEDQYSYDQFVLNKNKKIMKYKNFLYFYYPNKDKQFILNLKKTINWDKIDALIIPEYFKQYFVDWEKQLCILPEKIFTATKDTIFPNCFAQLIIEKQVQKYQNSKVYSVYYSFLDFFILLYKQKEFYYI